MTKEWADRLPTKVRVGHLDYAVEAWPVLQAMSAQRWGECSHMEQRIRVQAEVASVGQMMDTLLHEIMHAIFHVYGIEDSDKEERAVGIIATAWAQIWRDNPALMVWLADAAEAMRA